MEKKPPLNHGCYFHIFNRGTNSCKLFTDNKCYLHFLKLYDIFIEPIATTYAWCLMPNHFHLLVKIKEEEEIGYLNPENKDSEDLALKWKPFFPDENYPKEKLKSLQKPKPERQFGHLFSAYAKYFNRRFQRTGKLFEKRFERKHVDNTAYLLNLVYYIHNNPIHHNFTLEIKEYPWTSYLLFLSDEEAKLDRKEVLLWFGGLDNFKAVHEGHPDLGEMGDYIIEDG